MAIIDDELTAKLDAMRDDADGIVAADPHTMEIVYADDNAHETTGYPAGYLVGDTLHVLLPDRLKWTHDEKVATFMRKNSMSRDMSTRIVVLKTKDGNVRELHIVIQDIGGYAVAFFITPDKRMNLLRAKLDAQ